MQVIQESLIQINKSEQIVLKQHIIDILTDENNAYYSRKLNQLIPFSTVKLYSEEQTYYQNKLNQSLLACDFYQNEPNMLVYSLLMLVPSPHHFCPHFISNCAVQCNICKIFHDCKYCHPSTHAFKFSGKIQCKSCECEQEMVAKCTRCGEVLNVQSCVICGISTLIPADIVPLFHCPDCTRCITGTPELAIHCFTCGRCALPDHLCLKNEQCSVCLDDFNGQGGVTVLECQHALHTQCYEKLIYQVDECPLCRYQASMGLASGVLSLAKEKLFQEYVEQKRLDIFVDCKCKKCTYRFISRDRNCLKCFKCGQFAVSKGGVREYEGIYQKYIEQQYVEEPVQILAEYLKRTMKEKYLPKEVQFVENDAFQQLLDELDVKNDKHLVQLLKDVEFPNTFRLLMEKVLQ
ncbi:RING-finger domain-containing protein [Spironucleus salmonicida]|nr:RING-finger domain-containing protein [Spironucleus salmonicida]